jgi:hypothetical protein
MTDFKNICLAGFASTTSIFAAIEMQNLITIVSAVILPILFFCIGKAVDVWVQVRLNEKRRGDAEKGRQGEQEDRQG